MAKKKKISKNIVSVSVTSMLNRDKSFSLWGQFEREKIFRMENTFANNEKSIAKIARNRFSTAFLFDTYTR